MTLKSKNNVTIIESLANYIISKSENSSFEININNNINISSTIFK